MTAASIELKPITPLLDSQRKLGSRLKIPNADVLGLTELKTKIEAQASLLFRIINDQGQIVCHVEKGWCCPVLETKTVKVTDFPVQKLDDAALARICNLFEQNTISAIVCPPNGGGFYSSDEAFLIGDDITLLNASDKL